MSLTDYSFPAPPVTPNRWTERDWLRYARRYGQRVRRGPAPSVVMWDGRFAPFAGFNTSGVAVYAVDAAFRSPVRAAAV